MWEKGEEFLKQDKYLGSLVRKYGPCKIRPSKKKDYFLDLVDAITSQQLSGKAAATIFNRVKEKCGGQITPDKLKKFKTEELRACGLSYAKCSYVKDLAERVVRKQLHVTKLERLPDEQVVEELVAVKGIGRWTAEMFLMFSLARPDVFPVDDLGIRKGIEKLLGNQLIGDNLALFARRWTPYRTVASWYVWRTLENE